MGLFSKAPVYNQAQVDKMLKELTDKHTEDMKDTVNAFRKSFVDSVREVDTTRLRKRSNWYYESLSTFEEMVPTFLENIVQKNMAAINKKQVDRVRNSLSAEMRTLSKVYDNEEFILKVIDRINKFQLEVSYHVFL